MTHPSAVVVSVIIPVHNNADLLAQQLDGIASGLAAAPPTEILVVDNKSIDGSAQVATRWSTERGIPVRIVSAHERAGEPYARNRGMAVAAGSLLLYCDGDDVVSSTWLSGMVHALASHPYATGPIDMDRLNPRWLANVRGSSVNGRSHMYDTVPFAHGCNMGFQKDALHQLGGFDEDYLAGCDLELAIRAWRAGLEMGFSPDAVVHYRLRPSLRSTWKQGRFYGRYRIRIQKLLHDVVNPQAERQANLRRVGWLAKFLPSALVSRERRARWVWLAGQLAGEAQGQLD